MHTYVPLNLLVLLLFDHVHCLVDEIAGLNALNHLPINHSSKRTEPTKVTFDVNHCTSKSLDLICLKCKFSILSLSS